MTKATFELIVREHQSMVYSIACNFFHNPALAEEVAQDVFLQLYENRNNVGSQAHVIAWLRRTVVHRCIDALRQASTRFEVQFDELPDVADHIVEADPLLEERLRRLVASLPEKPRAVMILRYGEDMDPEEIGLALHMPVRTVWSHLHRATALLREKAARYLKEKEDEPVRTGPS
jgi:RNA polymerase sigma-70 factor, ECF subfamily